MATIVGFPLFLFIFNISIFLYIGISSLRRYYIYQYLPDLILGISFSLLLITETIRYLSSLTENPNQAIIYFKIVNAVLMPAIALWFLTFTIYYQGELSVLSVLVVYITGLLGGAFIYSNEITVTYDAVTSNWNGVYPQSFFLFIFPLILIAFLRIIQPLVRRMGFIENKSDKITLLIMSSGISLVLLWGVTSVFTSVEFIRMIRPMLLASGWLLWYLASRSNPFFLSASRSDPQRLIITDATGQLYFSHDFQEQEGASSELFAPLVQAVNNMALEVLQTDTGVKSFNIGNREVISQTISNYFFHLVGHNMDNTIRSVFRQFAFGVVGKLQEIPSGEYIDLTTEIDEYFNRLIILSDDTTEIEIDPSETSIPVS